MGPVRLSILRPRTSTDLSGSTHIDTERFVWVGLGIVIGFLFMSAIFGIFESVRGNSPAAYRAVKIAAENRKEELDTEKAEKSHLTDSLQNLKTKVDVLAQQLDDATNKVASLNNQIAAKKKELDKVKAENSQLTGSLQDLQAERAVLAQQLDVARNEVARRNAQVADQVTEIRNLNEAVTDLRMTRNRLQQELAVTTRANCDLTQENENLHQRIHFLSEFVIEIENRSRDNSQIIEGLRNILRDTQPNGQGQDRGDVDLARRDINGLLQEVDNTIRHLRNEGNQLRAQLRIETRQAQESRRTIERMHQRMVFFQEEAAEMNERLNELEEDCRLSRPSSRAALQIANEPWIDDPISSGPIRDEQIRELVTGMRNILHHHGECSGCPGWRQESNRLTELVRAIEGFMERLNDSMAEDLVFLILDTLTHLRIAQ